MKIRWQDWANVILGCWLAASPWEMDYWLVKAATANAFGVGIVLVFFNIIAVCRLLEEGQEYFNILLGIWLMLSPLALDFRDERAVALNAVLVGAAVIGFAIWQMHDALHPPQK